MSILINQDTKVITQGTYIGVGATYIARLHGQHVFEGSFTGFLFNGFYKIEEFYWLAVTNIVNTIRGRAA